MPNLDKSKREIRAIPFEFRAEENEGEKILEGRAVVYDQKTDLGPFFEVIAAGALDKTDLRDVPLLVNHNPDGVPLARSRRNTPKSTMQLTTDEKGLKIRARLDPANQEAMTVYSAVSRGDLSGMSFAFTVDGEEWTDLESDHPTRSITGIGRVFEVSAVTFPAYSKTAINARGMLDALESARAALESAKAEEAKIEARKKKIRILTEV